MALVEDQPRPDGTHLETFIDRFTEPADNAQLDAADLLKAFRGHALTHNLPPPPPNATLYAQLRLNGHLVTRGAQNRQWLRQRRLRPHALPEYVRLQAVADTQITHPPTATPLSPAALESDLRRDAAQLGREALARLLGRSIQVLEETLDDPDTRLRQQSALAIVRSFVPQAKARDVPDDVIDVTPSERRASLADIEAILRAQMDGATPPGIIDG